MKFMKWLGFFVVLMVMVIFVIFVFVVKCGNMGVGFEVWVQEFKVEVVRNGIKLFVFDSVFLNVYYNVFIICVDCGQYSFKFLFDVFMKKCGVVGIVLCGCVMLKLNVVFFNSIQSCFGVLFGLLIVIWGMEIGFGGFMGDQYMLFVVLMFVYDCCCQDYFIDQFYVVLKLVQVGMLFVNLMGVVYGEVGQMQFLLKNVLFYGVDGDGDGCINFVGFKVDVLVLIVNFFKGYGWCVGVGYQLGELNFFVIQGWNVVMVYQQVIVIMGKQIEGY